MWNRSSEVLALFAIVTDYTETALLSAYFGEPYDAVDFLHDFRKSQKEHLLRCFVIESRNRLVQRFQSLNQIVEGTRSGIECDNHFGLRPYSFRLP